MELESQSKGKEFNSTDDFTFELIDVGLKYADTEKFGIQDINLCIKPRQSICIVGPNGSGKTTFLKVLAGIIEHTEGQFFINDTSIRNVNLNHYRSFLGISISGIMPFEGTIWENIAFNNPDLTEKDILWAAEKVGLGSFIKNSTKGLNTMIYPEGKHLSYTISKKIVLARAIVHKPKLLILKDPLDQFDETESESILNFLFDKNNPWAICVVSRNINWIERSDMVLKMNDGKLNYTKNA
jgi:ABC-type multidrug transport system fused ATPase/permease subunit